MIIFKDKFIRQMKQKGIDIIINDHGFKPIYEVFYNNNGQCKKERFASFKDVENFCNAYITS